jgi:RHS repeat-associated protein
MKTQSAFSMFNRGHILLVLTIALAMVRSALAVTDDYTQKLAHSRLLSMPLQWVGQTPPTEAESIELWEAFGAGHYKSFDDAVPGLESFIKTHPNSAWVPSLRANMGVYYRQSGYFTFALADWQASWNSTREMTDYKSQMVADYALVNWLQLLASLGRTDTMKELFDETSNRKILGQFFNSYQNSKGAYNTMQEHPEIAYRCGTYALNAVAQVLYRTNYFKQIWEQPSPSTGFSLADLVTLSVKNNLNMIAVERPTDDNHLVIPSVVHWKQNHYAAIVAQKRTLYLVVDPTFRMARWLKADAINTECSGQFLIPAKQIPQGWRVLTSSETSKIWGKGFPDGWVPVPTDPNNPSSNPGSGPDSGPGPSPGDSGTDSGNSSSCSCSGMPVWAIMEPWDTVWLKDQPLGYKPAKGPPVSFKLTYYSHAEGIGGSGGWVLPPPGDFSGDDAVFGLSQNWTCSWLSFVDYDPDAYYPVILQDGGGERVCSNLDGTAPDFSTSTRMLMLTNATGDTLGFELIYPSGAEDIYTNEWQYIPGRFFYFISEKIAPDGNGINFDYTNNADGGILLQYVIDGDGQTNYFSYTNVVIDSSGDEYYNLISQITDPFGRHVNFNYASTPGLSYPDSTSGQLTNITDVAGISTSFEYTNPGASVVTVMNTPYGSTSFYESLLEYEYHDALTIITEPDGSSEMFYYVGDTGHDSYYQAIPKVYTDPQYVPTNRPDDGASGGNTLDNPDWDDPTADDKMDVGNSFYWNRQQFSELSTNFISTGPNWDASQLTTNDYILPRMRHWNQTPDSEAFNNLSMERDPSPDGVTLGEMTWYDYPGKPDYYVQGSSGTPILAIKVLPDGSERYQINQLDQWSNITNSIRTYSENGIVLLRTNSYMFAPNGEDQANIVGPDGVAMASYGYNTNHRITSITNAFGQIGSCEYNNYEQVTNFTQPNKPSTIIIYGSDGHMAQQIIAGVSTNSYTWTNDLIYTHTDARGLTVTNSWDTLNRLTNVAYPDGTSISYIYSNLDLVKVIDRMGYVTTYTYDSLRQKTSETDPLGHTTYYNYCECGALYSSTDALENVTYFVHDNQGNLINTIYPDGYSITNIYNLLRQLVVQIDNSGTAVTNWYDNQGLLIASSNNVGLVKSLAYDIKDRVTNSIDSNGLSVGITYDIQNRVLARYYSDGGIENYGYTTNLEFPSAYTNQIGNITLYNYDGMGQLTNEIVNGVTTNSWTFDGAGDLITLSDGKNQTTTFNYDQYSRLTNKYEVGNLVATYQYDGDNRLTNRWTPAKGHAVYSYDASGNLTNVTYPVSPSIRLSYDAGNRLTSMVDGIGTTAYSYDKVGQLLSEGGLWPDDTVNYAYTNRLRTALSLEEASGSPWTEDYGYDSARRLTEVGSPAGVFSYTYDPVKLQRVDVLELPNDAYITNSYDSVARLLSTSLFNTGGTNLDSASYVYNAAGQRTSETNAAGDYRNYTYDNEGELVTAIGKESSGSSRLQEQFGYAYDAAGNLNFRTNNALIQAFNVNNLNELTTATNHGTLTVAGTTTIPVTSVTVNGLSANHYADATFALGGFTVTNGVNFYQAIGEDSSGDFSTNGVTVNFPATNNYTYDLNGNLLTDGTRIFAYDDENELISVCVSNAWSNSFAYDGKMRRRIEQDYTWNSSWVETNEVHFIYDGNVVIEERSAGNNPLVSYTRGNDLSGTLQGAGGIGGLLARSVYDQEIPGSSMTAFYHADGNGNITALMYPSQQIAAKYLYDPYGNTLAMCGPLANFNKYRFSSKEWNVNAGLYYYGRRFYDPNLQRWVNRDPIQEKGGINLYAFDGNNSINNLDPIGDNAYDLALKLMGLQVPKAIGGSVSALGVVINGTAGLGINVMFFPDSCEIGIYGLASTNGFGFSIGWSVSDEIAHYLDDPIAGNANAESYKGPFGTASVGGGEGVLSFGASYFWSLTPSDTGGVWHGIDLSWSPFGPFPFGASYNVWNYNLIYNHTVANCLCYWGILQM